MDWRLHRLRAHTTGSVFDVVPAVVGMLNCHSLAPGYRDGRYDTLPAGFADDLP